MKIGSKMHMPEGLQPKEPQNPQVMKAAKQFESLFVNQLVTAMRKTVVKGGIIPESNAERIYESMLDQQYAERVADTQQLGLSKMIYEHLMKSAKNR